jgi:hypothetical protein
VKGKAEFGSFFAYHGSKLENFHSIIHRGLVSALNKRSAYGFGTYLSSHLIVSKSYAELAKGWKYSKLGTFRLSNYCPQKDNLGIDKVAVPAYLGNIHTPANGNLQSDSMMNIAVQCVAVVEVVDDPSIKKVDVGIVGNSARKYLVVNRDELMQLYCLILFQNLT